MDVLCGAQVTTLTLKHTTTNSYTHVLKEIFLQQYDNKKCTKWITQIKKYMEILQISIHMIETYYYICVCLMNANITIIHTMMSTVF